MDSEFAPLRGGKSGRGSLALWWGLNIFLVLFAFLAFVFAAASLSELHKVEKTVNNNYSSSSDPYIHLENVKVAQNHNVKAGQVMSYTDNPNEVGGGLGPVWGQSPAYITEAFAVAAYAEVHRFPDPTYAAYAFATTLEPTNLRFRIIKTPATGGITLGGSVNITVAGNIVHIHVKTLAAGYFAALFHTMSNTTGNATWIITGSASADYSTITVNNPIQITTDPNNYYVADWVFLTTPTTTLPAVTWLAVFSGVEGTTCNNIFYQFDPTVPNFLTVVTGITGQFTFLCRWPMRSEYLGNGYFVVGSQGWIALAQVSFNSKTVNPFTQQTWGTTLYRSLKFTQIAAQNLIIVTGIQGNDLSNQPLLPKLFNGKPLPRTSLFIGRFPS